MLFYFISVVINSKGTISFKRLPMYKVKTVATLRDILRRNTPKRHRMEVLFFVLYYFFEIHTFVKIQ